MTQPTAAPLGALPFPKPDLAALTARWEETLVLPSAAPPGTRLWHRRTPDGYLAVAVNRAGAAYDVQVVHRVVTDPGTATEAEPKDGRPPTVAELCEILNEFTKPGLLFVLLLMAGPRDPYFKWPNPVHFSLMQAAGVPMPGPDPLAMPGRGAGRGRPPLVG